MDPIKKNAARFLMRPGRVIVVGGRKWKWKCSYQGTMKAYCENGNVAIGHAWNIKGMSNPDIFERGQWKKTSDGMLTPKEVAEFLGRLP
jgi:hypothetical protein